jgi:hypothetical protein
MLRTAPVTPQQRDDPADEVAGAGTGNRPSDQGYGGVTVGIECSRYRDGILQQEHDDVADYSAFRSYWITE